MEVKNKFIDIWVISFVAVVFGLLTIKSGGSVIFIDGIDRQEAGNYVPFVLWFNFLAGFAYVIAGIGLWMLKQWAAKLSAFIVIMTLIVYALLGLYVIAGGEYEMRTIIAMCVRSLVWVFITIIAFRRIIH